MAAVALHGKCPVRPNGSRENDAVGDMEQRMNSQRASRQACGIVLIVVSAKISSLVLRRVTAGAENCMGDTNDYSLLVFLHPVDEPCSHFIHLDLRHLERQTQVEQSDKLDKVFVVSPVLELAGEQNGANVECP